jgi:hypothetical protein
MRHGVEAVRPLPGDASRLLRHFRGDPATWLPELTQPGSEPGRWRTYLWGGEVGVLVDLSLGEPSAYGGVTQRRIDWDPGSWLGARRVPSFAGSLGLRVEDGTAELLLRGRYRPPGGLLGRLADRLLLRRLAASTLDRLLADIAQRLAEDRDADEHQLRQGRADDQHPATRNSGDEQRHT